MWMVGEMFTCQQACNFPYTDQIPSNFDNKASLTESRNILPMILTNSCIYFDFTNTVITSNQLTKNDLVLCNRNKLADTAAMSFDRCSPSFVCFMSG